MVSSNFLSSSSKASSHVLGAFGRFLKMLTYHSIENMFEVVIDATTLFINEIYINKENLTEKGKHGVNFLFSSTISTHIHISL